MESIRCSYFGFLNLVPPSAIMGIPGAGIRENDLVARLKTALNFNRIDRALAQLHRCAHSFPAAADELKHSHGVVFLAKRRATHINDIIETLELDCSVDTEIGGGAFRRRL